MARLVLVHGAFGGAWCWEPVVERLKGAGHSVETLELPGSGEDPTPAEQVTLDAYAERICAALAQRPEPAVLVGHSMGGIAITQAAGRCPGRIAALIYVAAFLPTEGQSLVDLTRLPEGEGDLVQANMVVAGEPPVATFPAAAVREALMASCTDEQVAWACEHIGAQAVIPMTTPVQLADPAAADLPRGYVICNRDRAVQPALQRRMIAASPCVDVVELDADHMPMFSATDELVTALDRQATMLSAPGSTPNTASAASPM